MVAWGLQITQIQCMGESVMHLRLHSRQHLFCSLCRVACFREEVHILRLCWMDFIFCWWAIKIWTLFSGKFFQNLSQKSRSYQLYQISQHDLPRLEPLSRSQELWQHHLIPINLLDSLGNGERNDITMPFGLPAWSLSIRGGAEHPWSQKKTETVVVSHACVCDGTPGTTFHGDTLSDVVSDAWMTCRNFSLFSLAFFC